MGKHLLFFTVLFLLDSINATNFKPEYFFSKLYATKTPYNGARKLMQSYLAHTHDGLKSQSMSPNGTFYPNVCSPKQLSLLLRHGTRYPSSGDVQRIAKFLNKIQHIQLAEEFAELVDWENDFTKDNEKKLAETGSMENTDIAARFVQTFPNLFENVVRDLKLLEFAASDTQRTKASAEGFAQGMADSLSLAKDEIMSQLELRNDLLRFFENCAKYKYKIEEDDHTLAEFYAFKHGKEMKEAARAVSERVTANMSDALLDEEDLRTIWILCGYETAIRHQSKWCDMLTVEETQVLEYAFDLKAFWKKSYGYSINYEQACPLLADTMVNLHAASVDDKAPVVSVYFGHAETVLPVQALLGLFQDDDILLSNNFHQHRIRKFRVSLIANFATTLAVVMYDCKAGSQFTHHDWPEQLDPSMVQVLANEHPVPLPFTDKMAVSLEDFESHYYQHVHHCDFDKLCDNESQVLKSGHEEL